jgi:hypothetical protein
MKIHSVGAELFHADGQRADMTKLIVAFCSFAKRLKITLFSNKGQVRITYKVEQVSDK